MPDPENQNKTPGKTTPDKLEVVTKPDSPDVDKTEVRPGENERGVNTTAARTVLSNPNQADALMDKQADKARNPEKNIRSARKPAGKNIKSKPSAVKGPKIPRSKRTPSPPIERAGPRPLGRKKPTPKKRNKPAPLTRNPTRQAQGIPLYRSLNEAIAARTAPPAPTGPSSTPQKAPTDPFGSTIPFKPRVNRRPDTAIDTDDPRSPAQKASRVKEALKQTDIRIKKPTNPAAKSNISAKSDTKRPHKQEAKARDTTPSVKDADQVPAKREPSPPPTVDPKPLVSPVVKKAKPDRTKVADKRKDDPPPSKSSRKRTPWGDRKKR